jgi:dipeptidyl aminopeptidase/acylaminoacyl peptidase
MKRHIALLALLATLLLPFITGCSATTARNSQGAVIHWSQQLTEAPLQLRLEWAMPMRPGPYPTVIVHPGSRQVAADLRPQLDALALQGYLAVAVDYLRLIRGEYTATLFPWRERGDSQRALALILDNPLVDRGRVATLGFSLGGAHSLLLAASNPEIRAVVAYYPMTDFPGWVAERKHNIFWRMIFSVMRWEYNGESSQHSEASYQRLLARYSAINQADRIRAPVLIIHGDEDEVAPLYDSRRLTRALNHNATTSQLLVIHNAAHGFNLHPSAQTARSWEATLEWLGRYLTAPSQLARGEEKGG